VRVAADALHDAAVPFAPEPPVLVADYDAGLAAVARPGEGGARRRPPVLILTARDSEAEIRGALEAGVRGYLLNGCAVDELIAAVRAVHRGARHLSELAAQRVADSVARTPLTARETDVLRLMARGYANKIIAAQLGIAVGTVKAHVKAVLAKLDAASRTEAGFVAEERGLLACAEAASARASAYRAAPENRAPPP